MFASFIAASVGLPARARHPGRFLRLVSGPMKAVAGWLERRRQLRALSNLDDHLLQDIGFSRDDVERACSRPFWRRPSAFLLSSLLVASGAPEGVSQEVCKPILSSKTSGHSEVVNRERRWTGVFAVNASRCATTAGSFQLELVRLKEVGPDLSFKESFTWSPDQVEVGLDLTWDEWVSAYRISDVAPCTCRD